MIQIHHAEKGSKSVALAKVNLADYIEGENNKNGVRCTMKLE